MKIVINACHGGFNLSDDAIVDYATRKGLTLYSEKDSAWGSMSHYIVPPELRTKQLDGVWLSHSLEDRAANNKAMREQELYDRDIPRDDPHLVETVEALGDAAGGRFASLKVVEIPDDVVWEIEEYDGLEWVAEQHRTWQ